MPDDDWKTGLPDEIREHPSLVDYKPDAGMVNTPLDLVKSYVNQQALIGKDKIPVPGEGATDEEWAEVFTRLGRPTTAEEYAITKPENLPEEVGYSEEMIQGYKEFCHKEGILPSQAQNLHNWFLEWNTKKLEATNTASAEFIKQSEATLRKEWGTAYAERVFSASNTFTHFAKAMGAEGEKAVTDLMDQTGLGDHPLMLRLFSEVGKVIGEDTITGKPKTMGLTPQEAEAEIAKIQADKEGPYYQKDHPEHKLMVQRMEQLNQVLYPETPPAT